MGEGSEGDGGANYQHEREAVRNANSQVEDAWRVGPREESDWHVQVGCDVEEPSADG